MLRPVWPQDRHLPTGFVLPVGDRYWEVSECLRRVATVGIIAVIFPNSINRTLVGLMFSFLFLRSYIHFRPFNSFSDNVVAVYTQAVMVMNFLLLLWLQLGAQRQSVAIHDDLTNVTVLLNGSIFIVFIVLVTWELELYKVLYRQARRLALALALLILAVPSCLLLCLSWPWRLVRGWARKRPAPRVRPTPSSAGTPPSVTGGSPGTGGDASSRTPADQTQAAGASADGVLLDFGDVFVDAGDQDKTTAPTPPSATPFSNLPAFIGDFFSSDEGGSQGGDLVDFDEDAVFAHREGDRSETNPMNRSMPMAAMTDEAADETQFGEHDIFDGQQDGERSGSNLVTMMRRLRPEGGKSRVSSLWSTRGPEEPGVEAGDQDEFGEDALFQGPRMTQDPAAWGSNPLFERQAPVTSDKGSKAGASRRASRFSQRHGGGHEDAGAPPLLHRVTSSEQGGGEATVTTPPPRGSSARGRLRGRVAAATGVMRPGAVAVRAPKHSIPGIVGVEMDQSEPVSPKASPRGGGGGQAKEHETSNPLFSHGKRETRRVMRDPQSWIKREHLAGNPC
jgi:hypothetical protein